MKLPIHLHCNEDLTAVEDRWRNSVRRDRAIARNIQSVGLLLYAHPSGAVGVMYEAQLLTRADEYGAALDALGFKLVRSVRVPTIHAKLLRRVV
jgi:hypothetical protein